MSARQCNHVDLNQDEEQKVSDKAPVTEVKINNIGYNFPSDNTLRPSVALPQIVTIDKLAKIESIGIASVGRGYVVAPTLLVFDGVTNIRDEDVKLEYTLGDSNVTILNGQVDVDPFYDGKTVHVRHRNHAMHESNNLVNTNTFKLLEND